MSAPELAELVTSSADGDYAKTGFHRRYVAGSDALRPIAAAFRQAGYFLEMITCEDRRQELGKLRLVYTYNVFGPCDRHVLTVDLDPGEEAPSVVSEYPAADWLEREVFDMFGVRFEGHPNLKRILLPDDADFHALLKDFGRIEDAQPAEEAS